jgi:hypothetical protein
LRERRRSVVASVAVALGLIVGVAWLATWVRQTHRGELLEEYLAEGPRLKLRVRAYREEGALLPVAGAFYDLECQPARVRDWIQVLTFRHDDQVPIPRQQLRFIGDDVAYFFLGWVVAITPDAGVSWNVWDATKRLTGRNVSNYQLVKDVELDSAGRGVMHLDPLRAPFGRLVTEDFGRNWLPERTP